MTLVQTELKSMKIREQGQQSTTIYGPSGDTAGDTIIYSGTATDSGTYTFSAEVRAYVSGYYGCLDININGNTVETFRTDNTSYVSFSYETQIEVGDTIQLHLYGTSNQYGACNNVQIMSTITTQIERDIKRVTIRPNGTEKQIRPVSTPITTPGIYWSESLGVISFQTSNGVGISIADKNLGATQVYNSGDNKIAANMGYGYQRGNNTGWLYGTNPQTISTTLVNASTYGPGNYYSSSTFIKITNDSYGWDSSNNANLWGGTTDTYAARRGPCDEGRHIPSKADATTLVNAISSITGSVNVSKIIQYCKLPSTIPGIDRTTGQRRDEPRSGITYSDTYNSLSCGMLYLPTSGSYVINENRRKAEGIPCRAFSNTFIQPMSSRTKLN